MANKYVIGQADDPPTLHVWLEPGHGGDIYVKVSRNASTQTILVLQADGEVRSPQLSDLSVRSCFKCNVGGGVYVKQS